MIFASFWTALALSMAPSPQQPSGEPVLGMETVRLWPGRAPEAKGDGPDETPTLAIMRPHRGHENGTAIVVAPGGGYVGLADNLEGRQVADWFASRGVTAFVLKYRVGPKARLPIPFADGQRAVRYVRANAATLGIDPARIGMIGFSAGGHLSATVATLGEAGRADASDPIDRVSSRPDFLVLGYPWLEGMKLDARGRSQYCDFSPVNCDPKRFERYQPVRTVTERTPPTFIYHTTADGLVPAMGSLRFYEALQAKKVPVELHVFANGDHGTGLGGADPALARWPELMENWLRAQRLLDRKP
ncbi:alpha/beta hydrolase [Sphingomonas sp. Y38-1Y]|uniref:alpha/beta hydrolase n=1 Tax=Sphingomonas sp. Y38-1Y TaxID=3078265 RepID=UPI0028F09DEE|nr:alpha/beta hydrolase [Sphingomonas sp. Y38-1Y]